MSHYIASDLPLPPPSLSLSVLVFWAWCVVVWDARLLPWANALNENGLVHIQHRKLERSLARVTQRSRNEGREARVVVNHNAREKSVTRRYSALLARLFRSCLLRLEHRRWPRVAIFSLPRLLSSFERWHIYEIFFCLTFCSSRFVKTFLSNFSSHSLSDYSPFVCLLWDSFFY